MTSQILCSHNSSGVGNEPATHFVRPEQDRESNTTNKYKCGSCCQYFSAICVLHAHLGGGSYHYDKDAMTAFPLDENGCPTLKYISNKDRKRSVCDRCGDEIYQVSKKRRPKKSASGSAAKVVQIQLSPDENGIDSEQTDGNMTSDNFMKEVATEQGQENANKSENDSAPKRKYSKTGDIDSTSERTDRDDISAESDDNQELSVMDSSRNGKVYVDKEVTLNIICLETNDDGSVKLLLEEKDAGIFRSPHGEEIMKALKSQTKGMSLQNTQVVCRYSVPIDENDVESDGMPQETSNTPGTKRKCETNDTVGVDSKKRRKAKYNAKKEAEELSGYRDTNYKGTEPQVFMIKHKSMNAEEASILLEECKLGLHENRISKVQPMSAKGGEVYVVDLSALAHRKDIKHDIYVWRSYGHKKLPCYDPQITKHAYRLRLPNKTISDDFQKHIIDSLDEGNNFAIVHYLGDETVFVPFPHGNSKGNKPFRRTCPSVLEELKTLSHKGLTPTQVLKAVSNSTTSKKTRVPRNFSQIKNFVYKTKRKEREQPNVVAMKLQE